MSTACSGLSTHHAMVWIQRVKPTGERHGRIRPPGKKEPAMTTALFIVSCLAAVLTIAMVRDLLRDLGGRNE